MGGDNAAAGSPFATRAPMARPLSRNNGERDMTTPFPPPRAERTQRPPQRRLLIYSFDSLGLGHIRRALNLAGEVSRRVAHASTLCLTSAFVNDAWEMPQGFDYVKLPSSTRNHLYRGLPASGATPATYTDILALRQAVVDATIDAFTPRVLLVDFIPSGFHRELLPSLYCARAADPRVEIILGLRDVLDDPVETRRGWQEEGYFDLIEQVYDRVLVYGSREVFDTAQLYGFPSAVADKVTYTGYLRRNDALTPPEVIRARMGAEDRPLVVVTTGGGFDGDRILHNYFWSLARPEMTGVVTFMTHGPVLADQRHRRLAQMAARAPNVTLAPFDSDVLSYLNAADAIVCMGGYNTTNEALSLGKRPIIVPRVAPWNEQLIRARRFAELGLATLLHPDELSPESLAVAIRATLVAPPPVGTLDFGGLERAGDVLAEALG